MLEYPAKTAGPRATAHLSDWLIITPLILLSLVPTLAGTARLIDLASGATITPENARFHAMPLPVVIHILAALPFSILGAFQLAPGFRKRRPVLHRSLGRWVMVVGLATGLSGLYMTLFYPFSPQLQGPLLLIARLLVGTGMVLSIFLAWYSIRQRNIKEHRAWMLRAYALAQGAGTQVIVFLPWTLLLGKAEGLTRDMLMTVAWVINLALAEWLIRKMDSKTMRPLNQK
jgi:uncharacterized membrane protein